MGERIPVPLANLQTIAIFPDEPGDAIIDEIKAWVRTTARPHEWRGHSHTAPPAGSFVVYIEEFDVPAPDRVKAVAPCPCCSPEHAKYKNKGKIAWFPHEAVIRLIGPQCFAAINAGGHEEAIIDLRKRQKRRAELATIALHARSLDALIKALVDAHVIAEDLDALMLCINRVIGDLRLELWREVRGGELHLAQQQRVPFQKADGTTGERTNVVRVPFSRIEGHSMIDRTSRPAANKIRTLRAGLAQLARRLGEVSNPEALPDRERENAAVMLPKGRTEAVEILTAMAERQRFLTTDAIQTLDRWACHGDAPLQFKIARKGSEIIVSALNRVRGVTIDEKIWIGSYAEAPIPRVPALSAAA